MVKQQIKSAVKIFRWTWVVLAVVYCFTEWVPAIAFCALFLGFSEGLDFAANYITEENEEI
jgi:hypothetical protein